MKIAIVTSEPYGNYHFKYFTKEQAKDLVHFVPDKEKIIGTSFVPTETDLSLLSKAQLVVLVGGDLSEWTTKVGLEANKKGIPVVLSELAYNHSDNYRGVCPELLAISVSSKYGEFNYRNYLQNDDIPVTITGAMLLDHLPKHQPQDKRVLVISGVDTDKADHGRELRKSIRELESEGYNVYVRPHPLEDKNQWLGYKMSDVESLLEDLSISELVIGIPGTSFAAAAAMNIPTIAIKDSSPKSNLPEYEHIFKFVNTKELPTAIKDARPLDIKSREFITGPTEGSIDRILDFWHSHAIKNTH